MALRSAESLWLSKPGGKRCQGESRSAANAVLEWSEGGKRHAGLSAYGKVMQGRWTEMVLHTIGSIFGRSKPGWEAIAHEGNRREDGEMV